MGNLHDLPDTDGAVGVASEEDLSVRRPGEGDGGRLLALGELDVELLVELTGLKIVDLDAGSGGSGKPVTAGREGQVEDLVRVLERVRVRVVINVPDDDNTLLTSGSAKGSVRGKSGGGDVVLVTNEVSNVVAGGNVPRL